MHSLSQRSIPYLCVVSVNATWLCCTPFDGPLDAVSWPSLQGDEHNSVCMNQMLPCTGPVLGPFLERVLLVVQRGVLLPWLLCPHRPFLPAIGSVKHPRDSFPFKAVSELPPCHNARTLLGVGLHWHVPFIEDLSETVQVVW